MSPLSSDPTHSSGPTRRSVTAGALWSIPVISAAVGAPLAAASMTPATPVSPQPCSSVTMFTLTSIASNPTTLMASSPTGKASTVRITSVLAPGTTTEIDGKSYNLTQDGTVWWAGGSSDFANEVPLRYFEPGVLILNQRRAGAVSTSDVRFPGTPAPGLEAQTLTFEFLDEEGKPFDPFDVRLTVLNITSGVVSETSYWPLKFWSTVGFSVTPTSISSRGGAAGVGAGTVADPFRRATNWEPAVPLTPRYDTFTFRSFPSGSSLVYSQHGGYQGWHSSAITGLGFGSRDC
ncbi:MULTISPECIES: hypothetical protein [unclassified Rathayibacter]|uniref:hypothetical protein n=1 Tax=unclassified Rathayibacter TaxID=2609250 RepID=UPI001FB4A65F|nr:MULTISPECIES: hypothetical protein [unclassified Rathayibacter]MCJ1674796.1 hypothetical protein [Rathayibacter sp. VKM Ac-2929]MCJ1683753.1 hypothetical protein [Rathayibacter sp. VKM Ac-2928]